MTEERIFNSKASVLEYLLAQGYEIGKSAYYDRAKFWLHPDRGRKYSLTAVEKFVQGADLKRDAAEINKASEAQAHQARRAAAEADVREERARLLALTRREKEGGLIARAEVEQMLAARATNLRAGLLREARLRMDDLVVTVGGDLEKVPEGVAFWEGVILDLLDAYARAGEIKVAMPR